MACYQFIHALTMQRCYLQTFPLSPACMALLRIVCGSAPVSDYIPGSSLIWTGLSSSAKAAYLLSQDAMALGWS